MKLNEKKLILIILSSILALSFILYVVNAVIIKPKVTTKKGITKHVKKLKIKMNGQGTITFTDGSIYAGQIKGGTMEILHIRRRCRINESTLNS